LPVKGADVVATGVPQGEGVRKALAAVETWWIDQDFPNDREMALEQIKKAVAALKH
jgi:poly(A) polymerase